MNGPDSKQKAVSFVIFGATGDLASRKLFPALLHLFAAGHLPDKLAIIGFSRRHWQNDNFCRFVREILKAEEPKVSQKTFSDFLSKIDYIEGDFNDPVSYKKVSEALAENDRGQGACADKLLYLAAPPAAYGVILKNIERSGLSIPCGGDKGWTRILIEKPFGTDIKMAEELEKILSRLFDEGQIFRIDHYLAKETLQNILAFRFSNALFEPVWNRNFIESVHIYLSEKDGVGSRGAFYDSIGALRDVGQNHLVQMLALVAMDNPVEFAAKTLRRERLRVVSDLKLAKKDGKLVRGQYRGFTAEQNVRPDSRTETYFFATAYVKNRRWRGVPFYLESGKKMADHKAEITVTFKPKAFCLPKPICDEYRNQLRFKLQPSEGIEVSFWVKKPGFKIELEEQTFAFSYSQFSGNGAGPSAYEKVVFDAVRGDQTLFASSDEIKTSWKFICDILKRFEDLPLQIYESGTQPDL